MESLMCDQKDEWAGLSVCLQQLTDSSKIMSGSFLYIYILYSKISMYYLGNQKLINLIKVNYCIKCLRKPFYAGEKVLSFKTF